MTRQPGGPRGPVPSSRPTFAPTPSGRADAGTPTVAVVSRPERSHLGTSEAFRMHASLRSFLPAAARAALLAAFLLGTPSSPAQVPPEQQADLLLSGARRAYNEKNYPVATAQFREFLQKFG